MATITVTGRIITAMIVTVPRSKVTVNKATVVMVIKAMEATVMVKVMASNTTEATVNNRTDMVINPLMDTVINLPMVMDINPTDMDINLLMVDTVINLTVMVMDTNLLTVKTTTNNPMAILPTVTLMDTKAMEVTVMDMVTNNTEAMVINKLTDTVTNLPTDMDTKVTEAMVTNSPMVDMVISNLMVNTTATTRNLTEHRSDSNFISVIT